MSKTAPALPGADSLYAAFLRCSDEELQNPELSLDRQLRNCTTAVQRWGGQIAVVYYEIETGTSRYEQRGRSTAPQRFNLAIPRAGGLHDLMRAATSTPRVFSRVVCESINRFARNSAVAFTLEDELRAAGVRLHCADEPFEESFGSIVLRHLNVGLARGYHHDMMVKSRQGFEAGTRQGWHMGGIACYGYTFVTHEHPNPNKARQGLFRRTLELDLVRAPVVRRIYDEYLYGTRGLTEIRDLLNADLDRYPPPVAPDPARSMGVWSRTSIWELLRQPKYTGYQVWNRRARKTGRGRWNPPEQWIWSEELSHPPIITREEFDQVQIKAARNARSRRVSFPAVITTTNGATTSSSADAAASSGRGRTEYLFRGLLMCGVCGARMWGNRRRASRYYTCQPDHQRASGIPDGHPPLVYVGEPSLLTGVTGYLATAVYSPDRLQYWHDALADAAAPDHAAPARDRAAELQAEIAELERQARQQLLNLEAPEVSHAFRQRVAARIDELDTQIASQKAALDRLRADTPAAPPTLEVVAGLLDEVPLRSDELAELSQPELRGLLDSLQFEGRYHPDRHAVDVSVTLHAEAGYSQVWFAHPACHNANPNPLVEGPTIRLSGVHAKVRREGYRRL